MHSSQRKRTGKAQQIGKYKVEEEEEEEGKTSSRTGDIIENGTRCVYIQPGLRSALPVFHPSVPKPSFECLPSRHDSHGSDVRKRNSIPSSFYFHVHQRRITHTIRARPQPHCNAVYILLFEQAEIAPHQSFVVPRDLFCLASNPSQNVSAWERPHQE
jgi:hypothetical protein